MIRDPLSHIAWDRKTDAGTDATRSCEGRVDAHGLAIEIQERAARVARVDGRIGLYEILEAEIPAEVQTVASLGADDAERDGMAEAEGIADGQDPLADLQCVRVGQFDEGKRFIAIDLRYGHIRGRIGPNHFRFQFLAVGQCHFDHAIFGIADEVVVGQQVPIRGNDEAGALDALCPRRSPAVTRRTEVSFEEVFVKEAMILTKAITITALASTHLFTHHAHHGGGGFFHNRGEGLAHRPQSL